MYEPSKPYKHDLVKLIQSTWETPHARVTPGIYPIIKKRFSRLEVQHTDGIGTKGHYHFIAKSYASAVIDSLAMNLNDLALVGAVPYALTDHIVTPEPGDEAVMAIIHALVRECKKRKIAIVGGETSHHNNADGIDVSITVSGFITKRRENRLRAGDVLIGLKSNGLHSNGFTKVRAMFGVGEWRDDFVVPTAIYLDQVLKVLEHHTVHGMMHITGGAFTKLKDILTDTDAWIRQPPAMRPHAIFTELYDRGVTAEIMYTTFNCGVGFVLGVPEAEAKSVLKKLKNSAVIGQVTKGSGMVHVVSAFDGRDITV